METYYIPGVYRDTDTGERIVGKAIPACIHNGNYHIVMLKVYADGMIDCWGLVDLEGFKRKIEEGWVTVEVPRDAGVSMGDLFYGDASRLHFFVSNQDLLRSVEEAIKRLQGKPTASAQCYAAFVDFLKQPSEEARSRVAESYSRVAEHHRRYILGDQDRKDGPIRLVIQKRETQESLRDWRQCYKR